jgi:hypothetical protein
MPEACDREVTMGWFDDDDSGKSSEQLANEAGQEAGAHGSIMDRLVSSWNVKTSGSDSDNKAWEAGFQNGLANQPQDDD